jgi:hypothetical protein
MGLGSTVTFSLAEARQRALEARKLVADGVDPIEARKAATSAGASSAVDVAETFRTCAESYIESHRQKWRNDKHVQQWRSTLATYAYPVMGDVPPRRHRHQAGAAYPGTDLADNNRNRQ